jgi:hypothetical protein
MTIFTYAISPVFSKRGSYASYGKLNIIIDNITLWELTHGHERAEREHPRQWSAKRGR